MGRCKLWTCLKYGENKCCYECEEKEKCSIACKKVKEKEKCRFYDMKKKEEKRKKVCNFIRDMIGVAIWVLTAIGAVELFGDLGGTVIFVMIVIVVWLLPEGEKGEKHEKIGQNAC